MARTSVQLVVTDLDNTLYDWVTFFARSFDAMVKKAAEILATDEAQLLDELRAIHQQVHNSEQPFALLDTPTVVSRYPGMNRAERKAAIDEAFYAFDSVRSKTLTLYPGVERGLSAIRGAGAIVVAHTEASVSNALFRLGKLGLFRWIERVYAIEDSGLGHPAPDATDAEHRTLVRVLGHHERKPDIRVLRDICADYSVAPANTLYIGDSLARDIGMAHAAGAASAWAKYGTIYERALWDKLVRVTHWTSDDVARAQRANELFAHVKPDVTLERGFDELLDHFNFGPT
jgi:FMN phosphatase YigB (HAD superfamily)